MIRETSMKAMASMCNDFTKADGEWQAQLDEEGLKLDPKKDVVCKKLIFESKRLVLDLIKSST